MSLIFQRFSVYEFSIIYIALFLMLCPDNAVSIFSFFDKIKSLVGAESCSKKSFEEICIPEPKLVKFYLYTRKLAENPFEINFNNIEEAPFLPSTPVKVLIHGYTGFKDFSPNMELRPAYFKKDDYNLLTIDWGPLAVDGCYVEATHNVKPVGECAAHMLQAIVTFRKDIQPEDIHIVGFSLGAHVAGQIGKSLRLFQVTRITGLDPALPLFDEIFNAKFGLRKNDAKFVDVIHTNAGMKGKTVEVGRVDFYANGGSFQPGCSRSNSSCHHVRAVEIFAESINSDKGFFGYSCGSILEYATDFCKRPSPQDSKQWIVLGEYVNPQSEGSYYFDTTDKPPFARGTDY